MLLWRGGGGGCGGGNGDGAAGGGESESKVKRDALVATLADLRSRLRQLFDEQASLQDAQFLLDR